MKNLPLKGLLAILTTILIPNLINAQHFTPIWTGNPYNPMSIIVQDAKIDGIDMEAGDEIAVFDIGDGGVSICVGTTILTQTATTLTPVIINTSQDESGGGITGYTPGNTILYKLWDNSESTEIILISVTYDPNFDSVYTTLGTALVTQLFGTPFVQTTAVGQTSCPGSVVIPIAIENITDVTDFLLVMDYGTTSLSYTGYQNANSELGSGTLTVSESGGEVTMGWNSSTAANISTGTLLELVFNATTVYSQTTENITWDDNNSYYENSSGITLESSFTDGQIIIDPVPVSAGSITGLSSVCQGTTGESYQVGAITNATSYVWDLDPSTAGTINGSGTTITVDFSSTYSGQATLSVYGSNSCGDGTASPLLINIIGNATVDAGSDATICEDNNYSLSGTATNQQSVLWITSGDGTFDDATILSATYTPGTNDISTGTATLSLTAYATTPCAADTTDNMVLTIQGLPTSNAGLDATLFTITTYTLSGTATNQQSVLWTTSGDGTFDDATILSATYTPGTNDISSGTATLTLTAYAITACDDVTDNMVLNIYVTQNIQLSTGWNIISFYLAPNDMNLLNILDSLVISTELTKVIDEAGGFIQFIPGVGWMNTIGDMANTEGYYIKVTNNTSLNATGVDVSLPFTIPLSTGWNIMGYPVDQSQDAITIIQPLIDSSELIKVIDETGGFIQEIPGVGWMNTIGNFSPGEGYYIKVNSNTTLTID